MSVRHMQRECTPERPDFWRRGFPTGLGRVVVLLAALAAALPGCFPGPPPPDPPKPRAGVILRIAAPDNATLRAMLRRHGNGWAELSGATVELVSPGAAADILVFSPPELPALVSAGKAAALPESFSDPQAGFDLGYFLRPYRMRLIEWHSTKYALPLLGDSLLFAWRADLLDNPTHKKAIADRLKRPLPPAGPTTWQEVEVVASYFHETPTAWTPGDGGKSPRPSLPPLPASDEELDRLFHSVAAPFVRLAVNAESLDRVTPEERRVLLYNYHFNIDTGEPLIAAPGFVDALSLLQRLSKYRPTARAPHPADALSDGTAVAALIALTDVPALRRAEEERKGVRFGFSPVPGSDTYYRAGKMVKASEGNFLPYLGSGGWMGAVATGSPSTDAAHEFLSYLINPAVSLEIVYEPSWGSGPTRTTHLELVNRAGWFNYGLSVERTNQLVAALEKSLNPPIDNLVFRLRVSDQAAYLKAQTEELGKALEGAKPPDVALKDLARRWDGLGMIASSRWCRAGACPRPR